MDLLGWKNFDDLGKVMVILAYGETHTETIAGDGWTKETEKFWHFANGPASPFNLAKRAPKTRQDGMLTCMGITHVNDLVIEVVQ